MIMMKHRAMKEALRAEAVEWQSKLYSEDYYKVYDPDEVYRMTRHFKRMGKRFGLLEEFRENGIV